MNEEYGCGIVDNDGVAYSGGKIILSDKTINIKNSIAGIDSIISLSEIKEIHYTNHKIKIVYFQNNIKHIILQMLSTKNFIKSLYSKGITPKKYINNTENIINRFIDKTKFWIK